MRGALDWRGRGHRSRKRNSSPILFRCAFRSLYYLLCIVTGTLSAEPIQDLAFISISLTSVGCVSSPGRLLHEAVPPEGQLRHHGVHPGGHRAGHGGRASDRCHHRRPLQHRQAAGRAPGGVSSYTSHPASVPVLIPGCAGKAACQCCGCIANFARISEG